MIEQKLDAIMKAVGAHLGRLGVDCDARGIPFGMSLKCDCPVCWCNMQNTFVDLNRIAEKEVGMETGTEFEQSDMWNTFNRGKARMFGGKIMMIESLHSGALRIVSSGPEVQVYAKKEAGRAWWIEPAQYDLTCAVVDMIKAATAFEYEWRKERMPETEPPSPWRWGISKQNSLQLEADGRDGIELPHNKEERDAYEALVREFDARSGGKDAR